MNKGITVKGTQEFLGVNIPVIEGGFGEGKKAILAKTIAEIHGQPLKKINQLINDNISEFEFGVDILDLKSGYLESTEFLKDNNLYSNQAIANSSTIYLLSEQGYFALVTLMRNKKAKEIRKQLRREYFAMREIIQNEIPNLLLAIYNGGQEGIVASKKLTEIEIQKATKKLTEKIEQDKPLVDFAGTIAESSDSVDMGTFAKLIKDEQVFDKGRNKLFEWLRDNEYLTKKKINGSFVNEPYQRYIEQGLFEIKEYVVTTPYGEKIKTKTLVTGKGQIYFVEKLRKIKERTLTNN